MAHTKHEIQALLARHGRRPRHRWGQNFLVDLNLMRLLVEAAALGPDEVVLEVGTGTGSLTGMLAERAAAVVTVEIDPELAEIARAELSGAAHVEIVLADVLAGKHTIAPAVLATLDRARGATGRPWKLVANLPYQVASPLMLNALSLPVPPAGMFVTVQAEVAERMAAAPDTKAYGLLSIMLQATGTVERLRTLNPTAFWPAPQVRSAMVTWRPHRQQPWDAAALRRLRRVVDLLLGHRRKTIGKCLQALPDRAAATAALEALHIDLQARGETLPVATFVRLAETLPD